MIGAVMKSMDPALGEGGDGREPAAHHAARITLPLVLPGVLGAAVFVFAGCSARFRRARARPLPEPLLRRDHRDLSAGANNIHRDSGRAALGVAVRGDVRDAVHLPPHHHGGQL
jgi:hypothetical protein